MTVTFSALDSVVSRYPDVQSNAGPNGLPRAGSRATLRERPAGAPDARAARARGGGRPLRRRGCAAGAAAAPTGPPPAPSPHARRAGGPAAPAAAAAAAAPKIGRAHV